MCITVRNVIAVSGHHGYKVLDVAIGRDMKKAITSSDTPALGPYSPAVAAGGFLFTSGQYPVDPRTGELVSGGIVEQTRRVLDQLEAVLAAGGATLADVVRVEIFLVSLADFATVNRIYAERFAVPPLPARNCVQVAALPKGALVGMMAVAVARG